MTPPRTAPQVAVPKSREDETPHDLKDLQSELDTRTRERDEAVAECDEFGQIGERDGYEKAVQDIDLLTGGDGEFRFCTDGDPARHTPDAAAMKARIAERFNAAAALLKEAGQVLEPFARGWAHMEPYVPGIPDTDKLDGILRLANFTAGQFRAAANLHARIVEQGSSVAPRAGSPPVPAAKTDGLSPSEGRG